VAATTAGVAVARPAATHQVTGGKSRISLNRSARHAIASHHFTIAATGPATYNGVTLTAPVKSGTYTGLAADVNTAGGLRISHGGTSVSVRKVRSSSSSFSGTATVTGHGRIPAIRLGVPTKASGNDPVTYSGFTVTLSKRLVKILDHRFGTTLFKAHRHLGTGSVTIKYRK
jgi:hypothetical protein